jgi:Glutathione S-transferase
MRLGSWFLYDFIISSRAIMKYLVEKYGKDSGLIPENIEERAVMNQMLDFELGTVSQRMRERYMVSY